MTKTVIADHRIIPDRRGRLSRREQTALAHLGMISGCALLIDYVLTITISIASGADALFSFLPTGWLPYKLTVAIVRVCLVSDTAESPRRQGIGGGSCPIFMVFVVTHVFVIYMR